MKRKVSRRSLFVSFAAVVAGLLALTGCAEKTGSVSGKVTYKGRPAANVQINFVPAKGYPVACMTNTEGVYTISGVPCGACKVTLQAIDPEADSERQGQDDLRRQLTQSGKGQADYEQAMKQKAARKKDPVTPVANKYRDPANTPLIHNVSTGATTFDIPLES